MLPEPVSRRQWQTIPDGLLGDRVGSAGRCNDPTQLSMVRPLPVDLVAGCAHLKLIDMPTGFGWQPIGDLLLGDPSQLPVAGHTPGEGSEASSQMEAANDLSHLFSRVGGSDAVTVSDRAVFEKANIAGDDDAFLRDRDPDKLGIGPIAFIERVEAQEAEETRQPAQVAVDDEAHGSKGLRTDLDDWCDVERFEHGEDADAVTTVDDVGEVDGATVGNDQIDLGVRDATGLDHVLDASGDGKAAGDRSRP